MTCDDLIRLIEPWAGGDIEPSAEAHAHVRQCERCAAELALARRLEGLLSAREAIAPPATFTQSVMRRVAQERAQPVVEPAWLNEATTLAMTLVVLGVALLIDPARLGDALTRALDVIQEGAAMATVNAPAPPVMVALALVVASLVLSDWLEVPD